MELREVPVSAAWRHSDAREGFESVFFRRGRSGRRVEGSTAAVEAGRAWTVRYVISVDERWRTREAQVWSWSSKGDLEVQLDADGSGHWQINGSPAPALDGCLDVDLESSACTNTLPVHRLRPGIGQSMDAPAAYVRAGDLTVERLEQRYTRLDDDGLQQRFDYHAPAFHFNCELVYDASGLLLEYPGIATRVL
jgi:uncharacterized protein